MTLKYVTLPWIMVPAPDCLLEQYEKDTVHALIAQSLIL